MYSYLIILVIVFVLENIFVQRWLWSVGWEHRCSGAAPLLSICVTAINGLISPLLAVLLFDQTGRVMFLVLMPLLTILSTALFMMKATPPAPNAVVIEMITVAV